MDPRIKDPQACQNMADIRAEIDRIDALMVHLLSERAAYVRAAAKYKTSAAAVAAPERVAALLRDRRARAEMVGLDGEFVESLFRLIVGHFVGREMQDWQKATHT